MFKLPRLLSGRRKRKLVVANLTSQLEKPMTSQMTNLAATMTSQVNVLVMQMTSQETMSQSQRTFKVALMMSMGASRMTIMMSHVTFHKEKILSLNISSPYQVELPATLMNAQGTPPAMIMMIP